MAQLCPLRGIRYNTHRFGRDLSALVAPPYDVLGEADKAALLGENDRNIVAVDLPHMPPKQPGPDAAYEEAAARLTAWRSDGTLVQDVSETLYRYHQTFTHNGEQITRRMLIARLRIERFGKGGVYPHEQTFPGAKADRLKLMQTTRCNLSPIFGLYSDPDGRVVRALGDFPGPCDASALRDGVMNELWTIGDGGVHAVAAAEFDIQNLYIADRHHSHETTMDNRDRLVVWTGPMAWTHPASHIPFAPVA